MNIARADDAEAPDTAPMKSIAGQLVVNYRLCQAEKKTLEIWPTVTSEFDLLEDRERSQLDMLLDIFYDRQTGLDSLALQWKYDDVFNRLQMAEINQRTRGTSRESDRDRCVLEAIQRILCIKQLENNLKERSLLSLELEHQHFHPSSKAILTNSIMRSPFQYISPKTLWLSPPTELVSYDKQYYSNYYLQAIWTKILEYFCHE